MNNEKSFVWAQGDQANITEPIEFLKQNGWSYGDTPAASNFNWMFKTLTEGITTLNKDVASLNVTLAESREHTVRQQQELRTEIDNLDKRVFQELDAFKKATTTGFSETKNAIGKLNADVVSLNTGALTLNNTTKAILDNLEAHDVKLKTLLGVSKELRENHDLLCASLVKKLMRLLQNLVKMEAALISRGEYDLQKWPNFGVLPLHDEENGNE